jgi:3-oxoacid CoA-transferase subunit B
MPLNREQLAQRLAQEVPAGSVVNLGIGIPTLVANYLAPDSGENGLLGIGPFPRETEIDPDLINAGKQTITAIPGASFFSSADSFGMIRGGHVDLTILGAMQVDQEGNIANWMIPGKMVKGMGGAMDLVAGAKRVLVAMQQTDKDGNSKLLKLCDLPLTGRSCIHQVFTDYGVFKIENGEFVLLEYAPDLSIDQVVKATEGRCRVAPDVRPIQLKGI